MRIGLYGDSYCDLIYFNNNEYKNHPEKWLRKFKPWSGRLLEDFNAPILSSGLGGSCLYDSITKWQNDDNKESYDVVFWSLTWHDRLYTSEYFEPVFLARAERRPIPKSTMPNIDYNEIDYGIDLYYKYFYNETQQKFYHEQSIKWILDLPNQYVNTKFIFLPCTEYSRIVAKQYFQKGILVNFSFELISNFETNSAGPMPISCGRIGHLNDHNHEKFTSYFTNLIENFSLLENQILTPNFNDFDLTKIPNFDT